MIRKILVPVRGDGKGDNVLAHAAVLATKSGAHIEVAHCRPRPEDLLPFGVPLPAIMQDQLIEQAHSLADEEERKLKSEFDKLAKEFGLIAADRPNGRDGTVAWVEEAGKMVDVIKRHGRLSDVICVAKPDRNRNIGTNTLKAALFNTGRPVMMCPSTPPVQTLGTSVAIAWNGSTESVRAVVMMRRMIEAAEKVTILDSGHSPDGTTSADLQSYLADRDIASDVLRFEAGSNPGAAMLKAAKAANADVMIMGAFGDRHGSEMVFGGNTQTVVDKAEMPVVFVH